jgi:cytochrome P450
MQFNSAQSSRPPGPRPLPLVGHWPALQRDVLGYLSDCARDYGDVVGLRIGQWNIVLLSSPHDIEQVLVRESRNFRKHRLFWRQVTAMFGNGLLTSEGELWQRQRRLSAPAYAGDRLLGYGDTIVARTARMLEGWTDGEERDVHSDMMRLGLQIAAATLFGTDVEQDAADIEHALDLAMPEITSRLMRPILIPDAVPLPGHIRYRRGLAMMDRLVERIIRDRRAQGHDSGDLLNLLLQARDEDGRPMSDRQLRDEVITTLLAGHETTALALSWTLYLLGHHPDIDAQLAAEIDAVVGDRPVTVEDLGKLVFTERILKESMRLYPPAWAIGREALDDCVIGGYRVARGTIIYITQWVQHRDPRHFDDPTSFRPERWTTEFERALPRFAYFPFGGGPRVCIGNRFAMMEAMLVLVSVRQRFRCVWTGDRPVRPEPSITLRPGGGVRVQIQARTGY